VAHRDFTDYLSKTDDALLFRLSELTGELAGLHQEVAMICAQERRAKVQGFMGSEASTVTGRERDGDAMAVELTATIFELRGDIAALQEEQKLILTLLERR
jgi:hypothetical protein